MTCGRPILIAPLLLLAALAACNPNPAPPEAGASSAPSPTADAAGADDPCGSARLQNHAGQPDSPQTRAAVAATLQQQPVRWVRPGDPVTQDYVADRVNILLDQAGVIRSIRCG